MLANSERRTRSGALVPGLDRSPMAVEIVVSVRTGDPISCDIVLVPRYSRAIKFALLISMRLIDCAAPPLPDPPAARSMRHQLRNPKRALCLGFPPPDRRRCDLRDYVQRLSPRRTLKCPQGNQGDASRVAAKRGLGTKIIGNPSGLPLDPLTLSTSVAFISTSACSASAEIEIMCKIQTKESAS
jgi:hypothetical protein